MPSKLEQHHYTNKNELDVHVSHIQRMVAKGLDDGESRRLAVKIVSNRFEAKRLDSGKTIATVESWGRYFVAPPGPVCKTEDDECEIIKVWDFVVQNIRYVHDTVNLDVFATLKESLLAGGGDCFPEGTLLLRQNGSFARIEDIKPGEKIWGRDRWSEVVARKAKGVLPVTGIRLNNGSWLQLTEDHKVYVAVCRRHDNRADTTPPCSCPINEREIVRMRVAELEESAVLLQPTRVDEVAGPTADSRELALAEIIGYYVADGWTDEDRVCISGRDGHPKEAQKRRVRELCEELGLTTSWHSRYIRIYSAALAETCNELGNRAPQKHLPTINGSIDLLSQYLKGVLADSGKNASGGLTFTTTSRELALQVRMLYRKLGISCGASYIENHGGLGKHPIHRLVPRTGEHGQHKLLRVKEIQRGMTEVSCYDIQTDDHYVYLPEHDVTVSNCDDLTIAFATLLGHLGFTVIGRVIATKDAPKDWAHIFPVVGVPKANPRRWIALDASVAGATPGWSYPSVAKFADYALTQP